MTGEWIEPQDEDTGLVEQCVTRRKDPDAQGAWTTAILALSSGGNMHCELLAVSLVFCNCTRGL